MAGIISAILLANAGAILAAPPPTDYALRKHCLPVEINTLWRWHNYSILAAWVWRWDGTPLPIGEISRRVRNQNTDAEITDDCLVELVRAAVALRDVTIENFEVHMEFVRAKYPGIESSPFRDALMAGFMAERMGYYMLLRIRVGVG